MAQEQSPVTGIIEEDMVFIDFGEHLGKSVLEISDTEPRFYQYLQKRKEEGNFAIRRDKNKLYRLFIDEYLN